MAPLVPAVLKVSSMKSCFVAIPSSWAKHVNSLDEVVVFKILYAEDRTAFVSFRGDISTNSSDIDVIQLNTKYATALGLNDSDELLVQETSEISSPVEKVVVEPLEADDWEIMSLNAESIETNLLNQIRVVWRNQVFPVWAHGSSCLIKVVELIPDDQPGLLAEWTEIQVTPKERVVDLSSQTSQTSSNGSNSIKLFSHFNWHSRLHIPSSQRNDTEIGKNDPKDDVSDFPSSINSQSINEDGSVLSIFRSFVKSVLPQNLEHTEKISSPTEERVKCVMGDFEETISSPFPINFRLRVVPCKSLNNENDFPLAIEATTVYISSRTLLSQYPQAHGVPMCFVARLSKLLSPLEKQEKITQKSTYMPKSSGAKNKAKKEGNESKSASKKMQTSNESLFSSVCVRVKILPFFETIPNVPEIICLPLNCVAVSQELQRHLGLEVTSVVNCESIQYGPVTVKNLILNPISCTEESEKEKEKVAAYFKKWALEAFDVQSSLLISDGTLVSFASGSEKKDFAITLSQIDGIEAVYSKIAASDNSYPTTNTEAQKEASTLLPLIPQYGYLSKQMLEKVSIKFGTYSSLLSGSVWCSSRVHKIQDLYPSVIAMRIEALGGVKDLCEKAMENFFLWLKLKPLSLIINDDIPYPNTMLICGPKGVGKSTFAKGLCKKIASHPYFVYTNILDCKPLRGKRIETITKKWEAIFAEAVHRQPSVVFLDDLDELASAPNTPEQEAGSDGIYFSKIAEAFKLFLHQMLVKRHKVTIIATAKSTHSLHLSLGNSKERHTFFTVLNISPPGVAEREDILKALVLSKVHLSSTTVESIPWSDIARKTEGYMAQDLDCLIDKATHAAWLRIEQNDLESDSEKVDLMFEDFEVAFEDYTPSSLLGLQLHQGGSKTWKDVGGLNHVKRVIQQLLIWPMQYPKLFAQCPLKPQSSILLYGAPGTGKTLLGTVIAKECGLNFISIKGPELLSKYIGASEQAVRDLFQRGLSAKPCILFFDEFDAIAPKRGHDSTGVTDRVVNQLLTQMDGVESAKGVYIIAATSRPDLIDPALLRPGRLDKCVHCPLPDEDEREDILKALSSSLSLADDVDFATIAKTSENFSGADLQALLYSSQLEAFHDGQKQQKERRQSLGSTSEESSSSLDFIFIPTLADGPKIPTVEEEKKIVQQVHAIRENIMSRHEKFFSKRPSRKFSTVCVVIQQKHLLKTLSQMKPSVSASERKRYQAIYDKFVNSSGGDFTPPVTGVKRVTLA